MSTTRLSVAARTDVGRVRNNNEDSFTVADLDTGERIDDAKAMMSMDVRERGVLLVVSDGMGGHAAGEVASALVVDSLRGSLGETEDNPESMQRLIEQAVQRANADVFEAARESAREGMGATLTAVLVHQREAYIAEVGDSRAYVLRRGRLRQMTKDQSFVQILLDSGAITSDQAKNFVQKNWIVQAMGLESNVHVAIGRLHLRDGDRLLICSDGLYSLVEEDELAEILAKADLTEVCSRMIELANERGGTDNVTAIVAKVEGQGLPFAGHDESVTQTFEVLQDFAGVKILDPSRGDTINKPSSKPPPVKDRADDEERESGIPTVRPPAPAPVEPAKSGGMAWVIILVAVALAVAGYWFFGR
jgi:serine/threonine protein phosphatase PrpC